jgi:hypothetical protein
MEKLILVQRLRTKNIALRPTIQFGKKTINVGAKPFTLTALFDMELAGWTDKKADGQTDRHTDKQTT